MVCFCGPLCARTVSWLWFRGKRLYQAVYTSLNKVFIYKRLVCGFLFHPKLNTPKLACIFSCSLFMHCYFKHVLVKCNVWSHMSSNSQWSRCNIYLQTKSLSTMQSFTESHERVRQWPGQSVKQKQVPECNISKQCQKTKSGKHQIQDNEVHSLM